MSNYQKNSSSDQPSTGRKVFAYFVCFLILAFICLIIMLPFGCLHSCDWDDNSPSRLTCASCGRSFENGTSDYDKIEYTNFCKTCYENYQWAQDALGN